MRPCVNFAYCKRVGDRDVWDMKCIRCLEGFGRMTADGIRQAVFRTAHKGGVLCPACRAESCKHCGVGMGQVMADLWNRVCTSCSENVKEPLTRHDKDSSLYLVPHISKTEDGSMAVEWREIEDWLAEGNLPDSETGGRYGWRN